MNIITVKHVTKNFQLGKVQVTALDDVSITVDKGEFLAIAGPSGSGKTTLLNLIGCIDKADEGYIEIDGQDVSRMNSNQLADIRARKLSFIFQTFNLIPVLSAYENVEYPLLMCEKNPAKRRDRILQALHNVELDRYIKHRPDELSGGQRQRVAIARALVTDPKIILADEPTANLDIKTGEKILEIMKQINEEKKTIFVFSTHDPKVMGMASRIINIRDGQISKYSHFDRRIGIKNGSYQGEERRTGTQRRESILMKLPISLKLALRNVFRNKIRSLITLAAIAFGGISIIIAGGFFEDTFLQMREAAIHSQLGHLQLYRKGYSDYGASAPFDYLIEDHRPLVKKLMKLDRVKLVTTRITFSAMISTGENNVSIFCQGVEPEGEQVLNKIDSLQVENKGVKIEQGRNLSKGDRFEVILGRGLAKNLDLKPGDSAVLLTNTVGGSLNAFDVTIKGIFFTASKEFDDRALRLPIKTAQQLLRTENVQTLVVLLDKTENTLAVSSRIKQMIQTDGLPLELKIWKELADFYNKTVELYGKQFFILKLIITTIVILSIFNTINMAIWERTREIGTIMAMGYKKADILKLFLAEGFILGLLGGLAGVLLGVLLAKGISIFGIPMPPPPGATVGWTAFIKVVPDLLTSSMAISLFASLFSSIYPAFKASNLTITDALRHY